MNDLPTMKIRDAIKQKVKHFNATKPCTDCGSTEKYLVSFSDGACVCLGCCPEPWNIKSSGKNRAEIKKHNEKAKKLIRDNWGMPVVYGGYNTI